MSTQIVHCCQWLLYSYWNCPAVKTNNFFMNQIHSDGIVLVQRWIRKPKNKNKKKNYCGYRHREPLGRIFRVGGSPSVLLLASYFPYLLNSNACNLPCISRIVCVFFISVENGNQRLNVYKTDRAGGFWMEPLGTF